MPAEVAQEPAGKVADDEDESYGQEERRAGLGRRQR
jgi:hypothetical protein